MTLDRSFIRPAVFESRSFGSTRSFLESFFRLQRPDKKYKFVILPILFKEKPTTWMELRRIVHSFSKQIIVRVRFVASAAMSIVAISICPPDAIADIVGISVPYGSQAYGYAPEYRAREWFDSAWSVVESGGILDVHRGVGILLDSYYPPDPLDMHTEDLNVGLHQNVNIPGSASLVAPHFPDPTASTVTYEFDKPTIVSSVVIVQQLNGASEISGAIGNSIGSLTSIGAVFGPSGDLINGFIVPVNESPQHFYFNNSTVAGTIFQLTVVKSSHPDGFAVFRTFLFDQNANPIEPAGFTGGGGGVPEPTTWSFFLAGFGGIGAALRSRRRRVSV